MLVAPLFVLVTFALIGLAMKRRWIGIGALALLWIISLPIVANKLWQHLEQNAVRPLAKSAPLSSAIVVLSGMTRVMQGEGGAVRGWADGSDRFWAGLELYKTGRAPKLIFTGGQMSWINAPQSEGQWLRDQALSAGVSEADILVTRQVSNTSEEAQAVSQLLPGHSILLVTSAFHVPRARAIFEATGFQVHPFPVDLRAAQQDMTPMDFIPSAKALDKTTEAMREWLGRSFYAIIHLFRKFL